jgi:hypothetical protein
MKAILLSTVAVFGLTAAPATAETTLPQSPSPDAAERCVTMMQGFPDDGVESRYIFFRLSQELAKDITPELATTMAEFMAENETRRLPADWPMMDVVEDIADPVLRQAAPAQSVAGMAHLAYFDALCGTFVKGQVDSLIAFDPALAEADLYIREDALYLRQILAEALDRLGGGQAVEAYTATLVTERDDIEFTGFEGEVGELEALYMGDLDTKLATSNDLVNEGVNSESFEDALSLSRQMEAEAQDRARAERLYSLVRILGGRG